MLSESKLVEQEPTSSAVAAVWWRDRVRIAYEASDGSLVVRSVDVLGNGSVSSPVSVGVAAGNETAMTVRGGSLHVVTGTAGEGYQHCRSHDGSAFTAPTPVPVVDGFIGASAFTAYPGGLAILWCENAGGQAHLLTSDDGGAGWTDRQLPINARPLPALTCDDTTGRLLLAYGGRAGGPDSFHLAVVEPSSASVVGSISAPRPTQSGATALCTTRYHNRPGLHVVTSDGYQHGSPFVALSAPADLATVGGVETFMESALYVSLANDGKRAWVVWVDAGPGRYGQVWIGPYAARFSLPEELAALLDQPCDPLECPVDPRLVCAATEEVEWRWQPARVLNAKRGDLVMTAGDGTGVISAMLQQLEPRQYFDHMGIMVRDHDMVRHATMAHDRLKNRDPGRFMTGEFFGERAPVDGFRADVLTHGWPGTITQSIEDAFVTGFNTQDQTGTPRNRQGDFFAGNPSAPRLPRPPADADPATWKAWTNQQGFADPEYPADETYSIHNFPRVPAYLPATGQTIDAVVVKPAPEFEAKDPRVRAVLHRVADAAETIDGHYRFFTYTDARIALDPTKFAPPAGDSSWQGKPAGAAWAAGTRPVVCSSFVWAAVQLASTGNRRIELEGPITENPEELLSTPTVDGLYRYLEAERLKAGKALHEHLRKDILDQVYLGLLEAEHKGQLAVDLTKVGLAALMQYLTGPLGVVATLLGVSLETVGDLKLLLEDMPDDVATQMCNTFAKDRADETDEGLWETPGDGVAVAPDDIKNFWDAPDPSSHPELWRGLYGCTQTLQLTMPRMEPVRVHRLRQSDGPAFVAGEVRYRGQPIEGAEVRFGCDTTMTTRIDTRQPRYELELSAGDYEGIATAYWPATEQQLTGRAVVRVQAGDQPGPIDIELEDPPEWRRLIRCTGKIDTVRRVVVGSDDWAHQTINDQAFLTLAPDTWGEPPAGASSTSWSVPFVGRHAQRFNVRVDLTVTLLADLSIDVAVTSALCEHYYKAENPPTAGQIVTSKQRPTVNVAPGGSDTVTFDHVSGNFPPDRGHVEFTVQNLVAPA